MVKGVGRGPGGPGGMQMKPTGLAGGPGAGQGPGKGHESENDKGGPNFLQGSSNGGSAFTGSLGIGGLSDGQRGGPSPAKVRGGEDGEGGEDGDEKKGKNGPPGGLPPGLAKQGKIPPGHQKKIDEQVNKLADELDDKDGVDDEQAKALARQMVMERLGNTANRNLNAAAPQPLTPQAQQAIARADSILNGGNANNNINNNGNLFRGNLAGGLDGRGGGIPTALINPNATANLTSVLANPPARPDPTRIIDTNVLSNLRAGNTAGFIASLAGNVQSNLNSAALQFFQLTA